MPRTGSATAVTVSPAERRRVMAPLAFGGKLLAAPLRVVLLLDRLVNPPSSPVAATPARLTFVQTGRPLHDVS